MQCISCFIETRSRIWQKCVNVHVLARFFTHIIFSYFHIFLDDVTFYFSWNPVFTGNHYASIESMRPRKHGWAVNNALYHKDWETNLKFPNSRCDRHFAYFRSPRIAHSAYKQEVSEEIRSDGPCSQGISSLTLHYALIASQCSVDEDPMLQNLIRNSC